MQNLNDTVSDLRRMIEVAKTRETDADDMCQLCFGTGFMSRMDGNYRTAIPCPHDIDQHRERIAIEVESLDNAQEIYEQRI